MVCHFIQFIWLFIILLPATTTLLESCKEAGVQRFIYCSSVSVAVGYNGVTNGRESDSLPPEKFLFNGYASSKLAAERVVLNANSKLVCSSARYL